MRQGGTTYVLDRLDVAMRRYPVLLNLDDGSLLILNRHNRNLAPILQVESRVREYIY